MSMNSATLRKPQMGGFVTQSLRSLNEKIRIGVAWRRAYMKTFQELTILSDRDLADLGMSRSDLDRISKEAADEMVGMS